MFIEIRKPKQDFAIYCKCCQNEFKHSIFCPSCYEEKEKYKDLVKKIFKDYEKNDSKIYGLKLNLLKRIEEL